MCPGIETFCPTGWNCVEEISAGDGDKHGFSGRSCEANEVEVVVEDVCVGTEGTVRVAKASTTASRNEGAEPLPSKSSTQPLPKQPRTQVG